MTIPISNDTPAYTDLHGLAALKRGAKADDPATIRKVAQQFESLFTRMMLKSMRDAAGKDPMFGSDQADMYQSMADDQLAVQLAKGKGLGLADMLIRQLQRLHVHGADAAANSLSGSAPSGNGRGPYANAQASGAAAAYSAVQRVGAAADPSSGQVDFVRSVRAEAEQAGRQLGVDPKSLIAQAALETNWGRHLPQDGGRSSYNLFGIKAGSEWSGRAVTAATREFGAGVPSTTLARFRAYDSPAQSFGDYVSLLRGSSRYAGALNTGSDTHAFAAGLQRGGYATDPDYAQKLTAVAQTVAGALARTEAEAAPGLARPAVAALVTSATEPQPAVLDPFGSVPTDGGLKSAGNLPITPRMGAL